MKKLLGLFGFLLAMWPMISFGQNIGDIDISFCNSGIKNDSYFTLVTEAGKTENVCVNIRNVSWTPMSIHIDFVDGAVSDQGNSVCYAPDYSQKEFSKYISNFEADIDLEGGEEVQKNYELRYPIGFSGLSHGCISYYINSDENEGGVSMIFRKVNRIDVLVGGTEVSSRIKINDVYYEWNDYEHELLFNIENNGNIDQEVTITGFVEGWFNYRENFDLGSFVLKAGESTLVSAHGIHLPNYRGRFHVYSYISNEPNVDFSIAHSNIYDNEYSVAGTMLVHRPFFLRSRLSVVLAILILLLIISVILRIAKTRKVENGRG